MKWGLLVCVFGLALAACANGTVSSDQYPPNSDHGFLPEKTPLLNPEKLEIRVKPFHADDVDYVEVVSNQVYLTDGWYLFEYVCQAETPTPQVNKKKYKPIYLSAGHLGYKLQCKAGDLDVEMVVYDGPIEIVE